MKNLIIVFILFFTCSIITAQETEKKMTRKERRALEKEQKEAEQKLYEEQQSALIKLAIDSANWVLEADMLFDRYGKSVNVSSTLNFIGVTNKYATVQLGRNSGIGYNGVGGVTVDGRVTKYEVDYNEKKGTYFIVLIVSSSLGTFDIRMNTNNTGDMVDATIKGNGPQSVRYNGRLLPTTMSSIYKGTPIF
ncbi:DUF4251 domain-containing protein [Saccharicrinis aurantiacus]|uniref:DUF4251 domain-containing protein n=1 Tax=Saccharicrinis aurantiacus TaxID=1849719 RepID=UPI0009502EAB|nr:DUF4251 domain-containing protein [Saccharicrinis aurantiacus]